MARNKLSAAKRRACAYRNRAHLAVFWKGHTAALAGEPKSSCPYRDWLSLAGHVTFSRAYQNAWIDGWQHGYLEKKEQ